MFEFKDNIDKFGNDIIKLGKLLLGNKEFDDLYNFHKKTWGLDGNTEYDYRVYASNNTFNMNEIFTRIFQFENSGTEEEKKLEHIRNTTFLTKNGLFCCAKDIVDFYKKNGRFPKILVVFDYTEVGQREIFDFLTKFENTIYDLLNINKNNDNETYRIKSKLYNGNSVTVRLFALPSRRPLLNNLQQKVLKHEKQMYKNPFLIFVININRYLSFLGSVQNKSYLPLISIDSSDELVKKICEETDKYRYCSLRYHNIQNYIWSRKDDCKCFLTAKMLQERFFILPMYFFNEISKVDAREFINHFKFNSNNRVIQLLNDSHEELLPLQMQLITCILSFAAFCKFAEENSITYYHIDIERVCMNFGLQSEYLDDMKNLFTYISSSKSLYEHLLEYANAILGMSSNSFKDAHITKDFSENIFVAEDYLADMALKDLKYESEMRAYDGVYAETTPKYGTVSLEKFLNGAHCENDLKTMISTLLLIKYGSAENDIELSQKKETIQTLIRAK